jgi:hypothetical protein
MGLFPTKFGSQAMRDMEQQVPTTDNIPQTVPQRQVPAQFQNPFNLQEYNNLNIPDTPMQGGSSMAEQMLSNKDVPKIIKDKFWFVFSNDTVLSFVDAERKQANMLNFDIVKIDYLNSMPYYQYTFEQEMNWNILRNIYETKLNRAFGFKSGNKPLNERIIMQSQFLEQRNINENVDGMSKDGFFRRLLGRR